MKDDVSIGKRLLVLRIALPFLLVCVEALAQGGIGTGEMPEQRAVRDCLAAYKTAILNGDGNAALPLVTRSTVRHYGHWRDLALNAQEQKVRQLPVIDKFMVLRLRHQVGGEAVRKMTPETLDDPKNKSSFGKLIA